jgi:16S rRNA (cytosine967-C5)-methyltransferase
MAMRTSEVSPARACAFTVVRRVFEHAAYADRALASASAGLEPRDRALATQIAYGTVQRRRTLDHVAGRLVRRGLGELEPAVLAAIRIGLFQLLYLDRVASHAAVHESVELAKRRSRGGAGVVNAVLRRAAREGHALTQDLSEATAPEAAIAHSVPDWLAAMWFAELGPAEARELLRAVNRPPESALRVNSLVSSTQDVLARLPVDAHPVGELPEALVLDGPFDVHGSELWHEGALTAQSRASMLPARMLAPRAGMRVLDLCAAPGGKTTHLAALIEGRGGIVAIERHPRRAEQLVATCRRMRADCVEVRVADAAKLRAGECFDRVLVDPPCSGLGTLASRPDRRWRASPGAIEELVRLQHRILEAGAAAAGPGGALVYSVCTVSRREGEGVIQGFVDRHPEWAVDDLGTEHPHWGCGPYLRLLPHRHLTDGFFIARLRRRA